MTQIMPLKPVEHKKTRISAKLRRAIDLRVRKGLTIAQACEEAGYAQSAWYEAMKRPAIQEALREAQSVFVAEAEKMRGTAKARAIEVAVDLMMNAKSETVRARMVEFILSDGKGQGHRFKSTLVPVTPGPKVTSLCPTLLTERSRRAHSTSPSSITSGSKRPL